MNEAEVGEGGAGTGIESDGGEPPLRRELCFRDVLSAACLELLAGEGCEDFDSTLFEDLFSFAPPSAVERRTFLRRSFFTGI